MTTMIAEVYDALKEAGAPDEKARKAAEVLASGDARHQELLLQFTKLESRADKLAWMVGVNITLTLIVLGKLFLAP
jgi:hypothetical protein